MQRNNWEEKQTFAEPGACLGPDVGVKDPEEKNPGMMQRNFSGKQQYN